jgi:hypothetical protein
VIGALNFAQPASPELEVREVREEKERRHNRFVLAAGVCSSTTLAMAFAPAS